MNRILKNLFYLPLLAKRVCPDSDLRRITAAIKESEKLHSCEIVFIVEGALDLKFLLRRMDAKARALDLFSKNRIWDTAGNNGILIYALLAERAVEIICDRSVKEKLAPAVLEKMIAKIVAKAPRSMFATGVIEGINLLTEELAPLFPPQSGDRNEVGDGAIRFR